MYAKGKPKSQICHLAFGELKKFSSVGVKPLPPSPIHKKLKNKMIRLGSNCWDTQTAHANYAINLWKCSSSSKIAEHTKSKITLRIQSLTS